MTNDPEQLGKDAAIAFQAVADHLVAADKAYATRPERVIDLLKWAYPNGLEEHDYGMLLGSRLPIATDTLKEPTFEGHVE